MTNENDFTFDLLIVNNKTYRNAKAMCPNKVVVPQCVYDQISDEIRRECSEMAVAWQVKLCADDDWTCERCTECNQLRNAIMGNIRG